MDYSFSNISRVKTIKRLTQLTPGVYRFKRYFPKFYGIFLILFTLDFNIFLKTNSPAAPALQTLFYQVPNVQHSFHIAYRIFYIAALPSGLYFLHHAFLLPSAYHLLYHHGFVLLNARPYRHDQVGFYTASHEIQIWLRHSGG